MNRAALYMGVVICFVMVTAASFFFGRTILGEKLLNKPSPETRHRPGDQPDEKGNDNSNEAPRQIVQGDAFSTTPRESSRSTPRVIIEVKPRAQRTTAKVTSEDAKQPGPSSKPADGKPPTKPHPATATISEEDGQHTLSTKAKQPKRRTIEERLPSPATDPATDDQLPAAKPAPDPAAKVKRRSFEAAKSTQLAKAKAEETARSEVHGVQVGLFSAKENADARTVELQKRGYPVVTVSEIHDGQKIYRVQVGPFKNKDIAAKIKKELADQGFEGFVPQ